MIPDDMFKADLAAIGSIPGVLYESTQVEEGEAKEFGGFLAGHAQFPFRKDMEVPDDLGLNSGFANFIHDFSIDDQPVLFFDTRAGRNIFEEKPSLSTIITECGLDFDAILAATWVSKRYQKALRGALAKFGMEALGYYRPWHRSPRGSGANWGIYLSIFPICGFAKLLADDLAKAGISLPTKGDYGNLATEFVMRHELFHFHVERFAIAQEVIQRRPIYRPYHRNVYARTANTPVWLEEALAQASVLASLERRPIGDIDGKALREAVIPLFGQNGPGYRDFACDLFGGPSRAHKRLGSQIVSGQLNPGFDLTDTAWPEALSLECPDVPMPPDYITFKRQGVDQFRLPMPKRVRFLRFAAKHGFFHDPRFGVGDHQVYMNSDGERVHINYKRGEVDIASLKAMAKIIGVSLHDAAREVSRC